VVIGMLLCVVGSEEVEEVEGVAGTVGVEESLDVEVISPKRDRIGAGIAVRGSSATPAVVVAVVVSLGRSGGIAGTIALGGVGVASTGRGATGAGPTPPR